MPPPLALFSEELEEATFLCERFIAPDTEECRLLVSHTQNQQTTSEEPPQSSKDNFFLLPPLFLTAFSPRGREELQGLALSCRQVRYDKFVHFAGDLCRHLQLLSIIVIIK